MKGTGLLKTIFFTAAVFAVLFSSSCRQVAGERKKNSIERFTVTFVEKSAGGTLSARIKDGKDISSNAKVDKGKTIIFSAQPKSGYNIESWTGITASPPDAETVEFKVTGDVNVKVNFRKQGSVPAEKVTVTFHPDGGGGSLSARIKNGEHINSPAEVEKGKTVIFTAEPAQGYLIDKWTGVTAEPADAASVEITANSSLTVTVSFIKDLTPETGTSVLKFGADGSGGGIVIARIKDGNIILSPAKVENGKTVIFTASPNPNYEVESWTGITAVPPNAGTAETVINGNTEVKVKFRSTLQPQSKVNITFEVNGSGGRIAARIKGGEEINASPSEVEKGSTIIFTATADSGFKVKNWTGVTANSPDATKVQLTVNVDTDVRVEFESIGTENPKYDELIKITPPAEGIVGKEPSCPVPFGKAYFKGVFVNGRTVKLSPYSIGKYEVTYALWKEVFNWAKQNGYGFANEGEKGADGTGTDSEPVTKVNWRDCIIWCNAYTHMKNNSDTECVYRKSGSDDTVLKNSSYEDECDSAFADLTKKGFRLPTEAEWEFAARYQPSGNASSNAEEYGSNVWLTKADSASGAKKPLGFKETEYNNAVINAGDTAVWEELRDEMVRVAVCDMWYNGTKEIQLENKPLKTAKVGSKAANDLGIFDMSGNVYEWCWDLHDHAIKIGEETDPKGAESNEDNNRVLRGGPWGAFRSTELLVGWRNPYFAHETNEFYGFRIACTAE